jgi:hypothetical protein
MSRQLVIVAAAAVLCFVAMPAAAIPTPYAQPNAPAETPVAPEPLRRAQQAIDRMDYKAALDILRSFIASPAFDQLPAGQRHGALLGAAEVAMELADARTAHDLARRSSAMSQAGEIDWRLRASAAHFDQDADDSETSLETLAGEWPEALAEVPDRLMFSIWQDAGALPNGSERRFGLAQALHAAHWRPSDPFFDASRVWTDLVRALLEHGQASQAAIVARDVQAPYAIVRMRTDAAFDPIIQADPGRFDVDKAAAAQIERARAAIAAAPNRLRGVNALAAALISVGQDKAALDLLDAVIAKARSGDASQPAFSDLDQLNWTMDYRARVLLRLGRSDEALAEREAAAARLEHGVANVSQMINLADLQGSLGRPRDALRTIDAVADRPMSPYGRMQVEDARAKANVQLGDTAALAASLAYVRAHVADAPVTAILVLLYADDIEAAARLCIGQLEDPGTRADALSLLQRWRDPPVPSAFDREIGRRRELLRARPDVRAAAAKVGHLASFNISAPPG